MIINKKIILSFYLFLLGLAILGCFKLVSGLTGLASLTLLFLAQVLYLQHCLLKFHKNMDFFSAAVMALSFYLVGLSVIYYIFGLNSFSLAAFILIVFLGLFFLGKFSSLRIKELAIDLSPLRRFLMTKNNLWLLFSLAIFIFFTRYFSSNLIFDGQPSPWPSLWWIGFLVFAAWTGWLIYLFFKKQSNWHNFLYLGLMNMVMAICYVFGYGYDTLIHQTALNYIAQHGQITPLSPFYIGQYSLEILINFFTGFSFALIERWFLPALFVLLIFFTGKLILNRIFKEKNLFPIVLSVVLLIPDVFIYTSPFGFALILATLAVAYLFLFVKSEEKHFYYLSLAAGLAAIFIHPFVGLNIILWILFWPHYLRLKSELRRRAAFYFNFFFSSVAVVLAFAFYNWLSNKQLIVYNPISYLAEFFNIFGDPIWYRRYDYTWLEYLIYFYERIHIFLVILFVVYFFPVKLLKRHRENILTAIVLSALASAWLFIASFSIENYYYGDQVNYAYRLIQVSKWLAWPLVLVLTTWLLGWLKKQKRYWIIAISVSLVFIITISWYLTYPRQDNISQMTVNSARAIDVKAVNLIYREENGKEGYLVLANQLFGALAVKEYGFEPYYQNQNEKFLYYSLPWGGQLAKLYNQFMDRADGEIDEYLNRAENIAKAAGLHKFYFIFTDIWAPHEPTIEALNAKASYRWNIDNQVFIYKFEF